MLRTLPSRHCADLEELLPGALSNCTMVNGLECKLNNQDSKVSLVALAHALRTDSITGSCSWHSTGSS